MFFQSLEIGSNQFIPGFEEEMIGMKKGESKEIDLTFPESYHVEELKNAKVKFSVELLEMKKKVSPELTDELVKELESRIETDSLILVKKDEQISLLKERDKANEKMVKLIELKWYENQYLWLGIGFVLGKI